MKNIHLFLILFLAATTSCQIEKNKPHELGYELKIVSQRQQDISDLYLSPNLMRSNGLRIMNENFKEYFFENIHHIFDTLNTKIFTLEYEYFIEKDTIEHILARLDYSLELGQINYNKEKYWMPINSKSTCYAIDENIFFDNFIEIQTIYFDSEDTLSLPHLINWGIGLKSSYRPKRNDKDNRDILLGLMWPSTQEHVQLYLESKNNSLYYSILYASIPRTETIKFLDISSQKTYQKIFNTTNKIKERAKAFLDSTNVLVLPFEIE